MDFDLDNTLYFFIAGRYEFGNKGADIYIEALARLNHYMKVRRTTSTLLCLLDYSVHDLSSDHVFCLHIFLSSLIWSSIGFFLVVH